MTNTISISEGSRVPADLQAVFIAASLGQEIDKPPPKAASFSYYLSWIWDITGAFDSVSSLDTSVETAEPTNPSKPTKASRKEPGEKKTFFGRWKSSTKQNKKRAKQLDINAPNAPIPITNFKPKQVSPQAYISCILRHRRYSTKEFAALETAYYNDPTPLQEASYGPNMVEVLRKGNVEALREMLQVGLSPNACNRHSESLVHMACQFGKPEILQVLLQFQCHVRVADNRGRTPLHSACWVQKLDFKVIEMLLQVDRHLLFIADATGALPLSYLRQDHWNETTKFLMAKKDQIWPDRSMDSNFSESDPPLTMFPPNSCPISDPEKYVCPMIASLVAEGKMTVMEAFFLADEGDDMEDDSESFFDCEEYTADLADLDFDDLSTATIDEEELDNLLQSLGASNPSE
uniref:Uncharacterized protein n=1 Tax=Amphora coffeiformis TaxID=265554 RepID=A0A7S3L4T5_9STRA|mmetsp:Transcript_9614/g.18552  ORF Transcript_9614/g.18552 Transcript_9614/m.18552 type:complete len:405 (+) Transcript_9614:40-1254(+)|eukprot:scaffold17818_cov199-Amphora_coffeaeformis.AAC.3